MQQHTVFSPLVRFGFAFAALLAAVGCADENDNASDCNRICDRYRSCFNSSSHTQACYDRCQARGTSNAEDRRRIDTCSACINNLSCAGAVFSCGTDCSTVVP